MKRRLEVLSFLSVEGARPHTRARLFLDDINRGVEGPETTALKITMYNFTVKCRTTFYRSMLIFIFLYRCSFTLQSFQSLWTPTIAGTKDHT